MEGKRLFMVGKALIVTVLSLIFVSAAWAIKSAKEYEFKGVPDGAQPNTGLISDGAGNLYGTTTLGGENNKCGNANGCGVVFMLSRNQSQRWTKTLIYKFTNGPDGAYPQGNLTLDSMGRIYGTATGGGANSSGTVFRLSPNQGGTWTESTLYSFRGASDGGQPAAGVILDSVGNLYGTTQGGGICNPYCNGVVFKLALSNGQWTETTLYSFPNGSNEFASGGLTFDDAGDLFGTKFVGGGAQCQCGIVFELTPNQDGTWTESDLHDFTFGLDGGGPSSGLTIDSAGNLYGETLYGGSFACPTSGCGVIFELSPISGGWNYTVVYTFNGLNGSKGASPRGGLTIGSKGELYGTTWGGGDPSCFNGYGCGTIFKLFPKDGGGYSLSMIGRFDGANGSSPVGGVTTDAEGNLYGTASQGGDLSCSADFSTGCGVLFAITP